GTVDPLQVRPFLTVAETVSVIFTDQTGNAQTFDFPSTTVTLPDNNLSPLVDVDTPRCLVEESWFDCAVGTSTAHVTKSDIDGTVSYDTAALLSGGWIDLGNGIYSKLGAYGTATLNTTGINASDLTGTGWHYAGHGVYEKYGVDFGSGNFET